MQHTLFLKNMLADYSVWSSEREKYYSHSLINKNKNYPSSTNIVKTVFSASKDSINQNEGLCI